MKTKLQTNLFDEPDDDWNPKLRCIPCGYIGRLDSFDCCGACADYVFCPQCSLMIDIDDGTRHNPTECHGCVAGKTPAGEIWITNRLDET